MYHTYIIFSEKLNKYYVGATEDLERRLVEHNSGCSLTLKLARLGNCFGLQNFIAVQKPWPKRGKSKERKVESILNG